MKVNNNNLVCEYSNKNDSSKYNEKLILPVRTNDINNHLVFLIFPFGYSTPSPLWILLVSLRGDRNRELISLQVGKDCKILIYLISEYPKDNKSRCK